MKNMPEIRFKGFTDAWVQRKLGEVFKQTVEYVNPKEEDIELWSLTVESGLTPKTERYNREFLVKKEDAFKVVLPDEFIYNPMNITLGSVDLNLTNKKVAVSGYYITMRTVENHNNNYFAVWLKSPKAIKLYKLYATGGLLEKQRVQFPSLSQIETTIPVYKEQTAIGNFFRTLDSTIVLYKRKLDSLKQIKKAYLQQMFPQDGERVPKIRFAGFKGDWEVYTLGELGSTYTGLSGKTKEDFGKGEAKYVTYLNILNNLLTNSEEMGAVEIDNKQNEVKYGDIFFTTSSETPEEVGMSSVWLHTLKNIYLNSFCFGFRPSRKVCPYYMAFMLRSPYVRVKIQLLAQGISRYNISKTKLMEIEINMPSLVEQTAIGNFFRNLDEQITTQQTKLNNLKLLKSAYLQKMFV